MKPIRRVLIIHPYGIGDLLFVTPVLRALRLLPGLDRVDLILGSRTAPVIRANPHVDTIYILDKDRMHAQNFWQNLADMKTLGQALRRQRYDLMLDYSLRREYAFWGRLMLGIPVCAGLDYKGRGLLHSIKLAIPKGFETRHVIDYYCDLAVKAGVPVDDRCPELYIDEESRQAAQSLFRKSGIQKGERFFVVAPGGGESWGQDAHLKQWPVRNFSALMQRIREHAVFDRILILGTLKEKKMAEELQNSLNGQCVDLTGACDLGAAAAILAQASLFLGNDGGLLHMAHALRIPLIGIYGPANPIVYGPYPMNGRTCVAAAANPCYRKFRYDKDCRCLESVTVEQVWQQLEKQNFLNGLSKIPSKI